MPRELIEKITKQFSGRELHGFKVISFLSAGTRGHYFISEQTALQRKVLIKFLRLDLIKDDLIFQDFIDSSKKAAGILHPNAISIINVFSDPAMVVYELRDVIPISMFMNKLSINDICKLAITILDAFRFIYATGRCHGNLTPENIFYNENKEIKITDFFLKSNFFTSSVNNSILQKKQKFISPEVKNNEPASWLSDVYSLSMILECLISNQDCPADFLDIIKRMQHVIPLHRATSPDSLIQELKDIKLQLFNETSVFKNQQPLLRRYDRLPVDLAASVKTLTTSPNQTAQFLSKLRDIGENGVFVSSPNPIAVGTVVELSLGLSSNNKPITVVGIVRWQSKPPNEPGMGVQFVDISLEHQTILRRYLHTRSQKHNLELFTPKQRILKHLLKDTSSMTIIELSKATSISIIETLEIISNLESANIVKITDDYVSLAVESREELSKKVNNL